MVRLESRHTTGASVSDVGQRITRLTIPPGEAGIYRLAQLDDYSHLPRRKFPWQTPLSLELKARISSRDLPGTWGFGFWNDPFTASFGLSGMARRLPALPNSAWFFFGSKQNHLSFQDDLPSNGFTAVCFRSVNIPGLLLAPAGLLVPLLAVPPAARVLRKVIRRFVQEDSHRIPFDPEAWHTYRLVIDSREKEEVKSAGVSNPADCHARFYVDDALILKTRVIPRGRLGLVVWIDNQYLSFPATGKIKAGSIASEMPGWLEVTDLEVKQLDS